MYSAVSGLQSHQTKMDVVGNNIANVNTYGYKSNRATFSDVFYQAQRVASAPSANMGGTNPSQLGYGAKIASIDVIHTRAGAATTSRPMDVYINGDGFIAVKTADGAAKYTRAGVLNIDNAGNLVDRNGNIVLGLPLNAETKMPQLDETGKASIQDLIPIKLDPTIQYTGIEIALNGEVTALKPGLPTFTPNPSTGWMSGTQAVNPDSLYQGEVVLTVTRGTGTTFLPGEYTIPGTTAATATAGVVFTGDPDVYGKMSLKINFDSGAAAGSQYSYTLSTTDASGNPITLTSTVTADPGASVTFTADNGGTIAIATDVPTAGPPPTPVAGVVNISADATMPEQTIQLGASSASSMTVTGYAYAKSGDRVDFNAATWTPGATGTSTFDMGDIKFSVDDATFGALRTGELNDFPVGTVGPGTSVPEKLGQLAIVTFDNTNGLSQEGENYFVTTLNSGEAKAYVPGRGGTGTTRAGSLEMSNVDLSREFTEMIITQRGFQANTRMVTVSDEMLQELINMKR
jgi:flagellar hook protein FlgE